MSNIAYLNIICKCVVSEIIISASSPAVMDHLNESDLKEVYESVFCARAKWYNIGLALNLLTNDLDVLRGLSHDDPLREVLQYWLRRTNPAPTWSKLIEALRSPIVGEYQLAEKLEKDPKQRGML